MKLSQLLLPFGCALVGVCSLLAGSASGQDTGGIPNRVTHAPDDGVRVKLAGNVHPLARAENNAGAAADSLPMERILLLIKRSDAQESALRELMEAQQDKSSPSHHAWLTPDEFGKRFGPSDSDLRVVTDWLSGQGFQNVRVAAGRNIVEFTGSAGRVKQAFGTQIQNYQVNGSVYLANADDPEIPAALAPVVAGFVSLHNFPRRSHSRFLGDVRKSPNSHTLEPLFTFPFGSGNFYGVGPGDFATIYNTKALLASGNDGTGQTIAIVGETQIHPKDVSDFRTMFGLTDNFQASNIVLNGMDPGITSPEEESESDLDVQWSGAVAPGATVKFVVSASTAATAGVDLSALYIVEHNLADVMSESYGECEAGLGTAGNAFYNELWEQAAAQGITVVVSSGDGGSAGCDDFNNQTTATHGLAVSGLSGTPFNVSVGGTDFNEYNVWSNYWNSANDSATGTSAKSYIPEFPWNQNCSQLGLNGCGASAPSGSLNIVAGSGGASKVYSKPKWQMGVIGVPNDNHRDQPDISLFASPGFVGSGYLFCQADLTGTPSCNLNSAGYTFHVIGGTSASAPAFAGIMALVNQYAASHGGSSRQGNANINLYALAKKAGASCASSATPAAGCIFNDVVKGNVAFAGSIASNSVACQGGSLNCSVAVASSNGVLVDPAHTTMEAWTAGAGYDLATGLGSLNVNNLATNWASASTIATTTTLSLTPTTGITHGQNENVAVTVNVKPNTGTGIASGDVALLATLADGSTLGLDQFTLSNGAVTSAKTQGLPGGTYNVYAHYAGDGTNAPSDSASVEVTVGKEASQTFIVIPTFDSQGNQTSGNANSMVYGSNYIIRMYVTNGSATASATGPPSPTCHALNQVTCPTGTVNLTANGTGVDGGSYMLNNQGYTRDIAPTLTGGTYSLVANYSGDSSYQASTSATDTFTITPAPIQLSVSSTNSPIVGSQFFVSAYGAASFSGGVAPTGSISIYDGTTLLAGPSPISGVAGNPYSSGRFSADLLVTLVTGGDHTLTAKYSGDASYAAATSTPQTVHPLYATTSAVSVSSANVNYPQSITLSATISTGQNSLVISGKISFNSSFAAIVGNTTTQSTDASGNQILKSSVTFTPQQSQWIYAYYNGDANYSGSQALGVLVNVNIPDFTLGPSTGLSVIPVAGQAGSGQITVTPVSQTPSTVNLAFNGVPTIPGYSISLSPQQIGLNGTSETATLSMTPTVNIPANAIRSQARHAGFVSLGRRDWWSLSFAAAVTALFLLRIPQRRTSYRAALGLGVVCLLCFALGCGGGGGTTGGGGGGGTPPGPSSITLTTSNSKVGLSDSVTITATVTASKPLTGGVTFYDYGNVMAGPYAPSKGQAQLVVGGGFYGIGVHQITAKYGGDMNNLSSTSSVLNQVITGTTAVTIQGNTGGDVHYVQATIGIQ